MRSLSSRWAILFSGQRCGIYTYRLRLSLLGREQLAAPGLTVEQLAQEAGDLAFTRARVKVPTTYAIRWLYEPGSAAALPGLRHVNDPLEVVSLGWE